jgi:hypothetical protein
VPFWIFVTLLLACAPWTFWFFHLKFFPTWSPRLTWT